MSGLTDSAVVRANDLSVASEVDGEMVLLHLAKGTYYGLDATGVFLWKKIERGESVEALAASMQDRYGIDGARARRDLDAFLSELSAQDLIAVEDGP